MTDNDVIRLIVIDDSSNDAEVVSNTLRNAGHAVRATRIEDDQQLREALRAEPHHDLVLAKPRIPYFTALDAIAVINRLGCSVPVMLLVNGTEGELLEDALKAGARDAVDVEDESRLLHAIRREVQTARECREHATCRRLLEVTEQRVQTLVESSRDAIAYIHDGMHVYANPSYLQLFGYEDFSEIEGLPIIDLMASAEQDRFRTFLRRFRGSRAASRIDTQGVRTDSSPVPLSLELAEATFEGEACQQVVIRDEGAEKELARKLDDLAKHDLLTGLFNRQFLLEYLKRLFTQSGRKGALLSIEPDHFKSLRAEIGIGGTDLVLTDLASLIQQAVGETSEVVARFDDQTFAAVLLGVGPQKAERVAERIRQAVADYVGDVAGRTVTTTCSIGIARFDQTMDSPLEVLGRAEKARQAVMDAGGNELRAYNPGAEEMAERERLSQWAARIKAALRNNRFRLLYQPIVSLRGDRQENYEVLLRMLDESGSEIPPDEFLSLAEEAGLMVALDRWVLMQAAKRLSERAASGKKTNLFVKLSAGSLTDSTFLPWLRDLLLGKGLEADSLTLEVPEHIAHNHLKALKVMTEGLAQLRIRFALDHFNLAPNWANLLRHCDATFLKVDVDLIRDIARNKQKQEKVAELAAQAKSHGKHTIAQHVEDPNTLASLWTCGVDYAQGYFLQGPQAGLDFDFTSV